MSRVVYVLPVHNEETILASSVARVVERLRESDGAEIFLVENGSTDASWRIARELEAAGGPVPVRAFSEPNAGIGYAYHRGLEEALARYGPSSERWAVLTAADLPFAFTDLDAAAALLDGTSGRMMIGSKAHPSSDADMGPKRRAMSAVYRLARRAVLGMHVGDSQGSIFLRLDLAGELVPRIASRNFFYSTELCHYAERAGETIVELPVVLDRERRASTVRPWRDGTNMARQLWELRRLTRSSNA